MGKIIRTKLKTGLLGVTAYYNQLFYKSLFYKSFFLYKFTPPKKTQPQQLKNKKNMPEN